MVDGNHMMKINVIYEDNHLILVEKPPNILSQADITGDIDMVSLVKDYIKNKYNKPGNVYLGLLHRLDRPVGGLLLFAKTIPALLFSSPPMIAGIVRISTVSPLLNKSKADQDKNALFTSICIIFLSILSPRSL